MRAGLIQDPNPFDRYNIQYYSINILQEWRFYSLMSCELCWCFHHLLPILNCHVGGFEVTYCLDWVRMGGSSPWSTFVNTFSFNSRLVFLWLISVCMCVRACAFVCARACLLTIYCAPKWQSFECGTVKVRG